MDITCFLPASTLPVARETDSWHGESATTLSATTGDGVGASLIGLEASLSVLGDSGAGFEPPAPPVADPHQHFHNQQKRYPNSQPKERLPGSGMYSSGSGVAAGTIGESHNDVTMGVTGSKTDSSLGGGRGGGESRGGGGGEGGGSGNRRDDHASASASVLPVDDERDRHNGGRRSVEDNRKVSSTSSVGGERYRPANDDRTATLDGGERVLHGVSAAMASGALPSTHPNTAAARSRDSSARREHSSEKIEVSLRLRAQVGDRGSDIQGARIDEHGGGGRGGEGGGGYDAGAARGLALRENDDGREQARRHIDQALRDRALRRRRRCVYVRGRKMKLEHKKV